MRYFAVLLSITLIFAPCATASELDKFKEFYGNAQTAVNGCVKASEKTQKTICLNALNFVRLQKQMIPWQNPEIHIMMDALELMPVMMLSHSYLKDANTPVFCDYAHTGGLLYRDLMSDADALIESDAEFSDKLGPKMEGMRSLQKTLNEYKIACLNERVIFDVR